MSQLDICVVGKYPPIQGGVSRSNLWESIALIQQGCSVTVVTNAAETESVYRTDNALYESYVPPIEAFGLGLPVVLSTTSNERQLAHIPAANPYVSKLAGVAAEVLEARNVDIFLGYYLEPYGVAAALAASWTGSPYGLRHAGSDVGRLYRHPGLRQTFERVAQSADFWLTNARVSRGLQLMGVDPARLYTLIPDALPPQLFNPAVKPMPLAAVIDHWRTLDSDALNQDSIFDPELPTVGMYGKIGITKGSYDILAAAAILRDRGRRFNLVVVGDAKLGGARRLRGEAQRYGVSSQLTILPFMPPWGIPGFIRACEAVAFLERDFSITIHGSKVPREILACGTRLILSNDIASRVAYRSLLIDRENSLIADPRRDTELASAIEFAITDRDVKQNIGVRGAQEISQRIEDWPSFASRLRGLLDEIRDDIATRRYELSVAELQACFARLSADRAYRRWFALAPEAALVDYELSDEEAQCLRIIDDKMLENFAQSLLSKRRKAILSYFPLTTAVAPTEAERLFARYYDLHPARPRQRLTEVAKSFADFLCDCLGAESSHTEAAAIAAFERLELRARTTSLASDSLVFLSEPAPTFSPDLLSAETTLSLSEGVQVGAFSCDVAATVKQLRAGEQPTFEPASQILVICPSSTGSPDVYRVSSVTRQVLDSCSSGIRFAELAACVPADVRGSLEDRVSRLVSRAILRASVDK